MNSNQKAKPVIWLFFIVILCHHWWGCSDTSQESSSKDPIPIDSDVPINVLTPEEVEKEWVLLFDGKSLDHWQSSNLLDTNHLHWQVDTISGTFFNQSSGPTLITTSQFSNFELKLDFSLTDSVDSGIFYRMEVIDSIFNPTNTLQFSLTGAAFFPPSVDSLFQLNSSGNVDDLFGFTHRYLFPHEKWNRARIIVLGNHVEHWLNGRRTIEYEIESEAWKNLVKKSKFRNFPKYGKSKMGYIGLEANDHLIRFRNIKIREL